MGTCPVLPRSQHTDMSPCCASPVEERSVVTAIAGSARCRLRLIDSEPELRPFGARYHKIGHLSTDNIVRFLFLKNVVDSKKVESWK